jgi:acyl carrier protein
MEDIKLTTKAYILKEFLPGERPEELSDSTPLITGAILDSLGILQLVSFLEERYGIELEAHEVSVDYFDTISDIARLVQAKREAGA